MMGATPEQARHSSQPGLLRARLAVSHTGTGKGRRALVCIHRQGVSLCPRAGDWPCIDGIGHWGAALEPSASHTTAPDQYTRETAGA